MTDDPVRALRLRVADVVDETAEARSIVFDADLDYRPGQFLTLRVPSDEHGSVARCYSLSSSPWTGDRPQVTVKRDGYASNWLCDHVRPGDEIEVLPASGVFTPADLAGDLALFAGGSGITPVLSIIRSALAHGSGTLTLVYANRDEDAVIFAAALRELEDAYPGRLTVVHWLESLQGLPTAERLIPLVAPLAGREALVCGPAPYMRAVATALAACGTPRSAIRKETFVSLGGNPFDVVGTATGDAATGDADVAVDPPATVTVDLDGATSTHSWDRRAPLLDMLLEAGLDAPYSCREGRCSACACRVTSGEVKMRRNEVLDSDDIADGIVLACQSLPITDDVSISYE